MCCQVALLHLGSHVLMRTFVSKQRAVQRCASVLYREQA